MFSNQNNYLFAGSSIEKDEDVTYHCITTDHPYMNELGLSSFTLKDLYIWLNKVESGRYRNLEVISSDSEITEKPEIDILNLVATVLLLNNINDGFLYPWRSAGRGGDYSKQTLDNWDFYKKYKKVNLSLGDFEQKKASLKKPVSLSEGFSVELIEDKDSLFVDVLSNIIICNDYVRYLKVVDKNKYSEKDKARIEFILDIKSGKYHFFEWESRINFNLNVGVTTNNNNNTCKKEEVVKFKLFLYDEEVPRDDARKLALSNFTIVAPKKDYFGRTGSREDGELESPGINPKASSAIAAPLDSTWNEFTGRWESGTPQILGVITVPAPAAKPVDLDFLKSASIEDLLNSKNQHQVTIGSAIPLVMQNGNPLQIAPDYRKNKGCRGDDTSKLEIRFYNRVPRIWNSGEIVLLNKIDGVWQPSSYGEPLKEDQKASFESKWDFTYFSTNSRFYFRSTRGDNSVTPESITYSQYEDAVRQCYYYDDEMNSSPPSTKDDSYPNAIVEDGYFQYTSWDFMGADIGGLRDDGNALACTQFALRPDNEPVENGGIFVYGFHSAPFFGCVFPDGYINNIYDLHKNLLYPIKSTNTKFFREIGAGKDIFNNNNINLGESNAGGMFISSDKTLRHLPADIALNASPSGQNGSPVIDLHKLRPFNPKGVNGTILGSGYRDRIYSLFKKDSGLKNWLYFENTLPEQQNNKDESAFDLKPIRANVIQFRPLKLEVYASFEEVVPGSGYRADERGWHAYNSHVRISGIKNPIADTALIRNTTFGNPLYVLGSGLKYNIDIVNDGSQYDETLPPDDSYFPKPWWDENWMHGGNATTTIGYRPAGAVGVITASCSCIAINSIKFSTFNYFGVRGWFAGLGDRTRNFPSFGGYGGNNYNSFQTTQLFARVFHSWPKNLTLYDPRFFSVFHFNDGITLGDKVNIDYYFNREKITKEAYEEGVGSSPNLIDVYPSGYFIADRLESSVDIRYPTIKDAKSTLDTGNLGFPIVNGDSPLRDPEHSNIDPKRRGKLLPFKYKYSGIALVGVGDEEDPSRLKTFTVGGVGNPSAKDFDVYILSPGVNYQRNDIFSVVGSLGVEAVLWPIVNDVGGIVGFTLEPNLTETKRTQFPGQFVKDDFFDSNIKLSTITPDTTGLKITLKRSGDRILGTDGSGFIGFVLRGHIKPDIESIDEKPSELTMVKLTPDPQAGDGRPPDLDIYKEVNQFLEGELMIQENNRSKDNKYDLFLHFHNDVSHTAIDMQERATPVAQENQVTLTITVT